MNKNTISVIVPIYNVGGRVLRRCIDSVLNQTWQNLEIILVDDGSTDSSPQICDEYAKVEKRICVIHQENKGVSAARNIGVRLAKGEYISFVDADDYLHPKYFEILINGLDGWDAEISCCRWTWDVCENPQSFPEMTPSYEILSAEEAFASGKIEKGPVCKIVKKAAIGKTEFDENLAFLEDSIYTKTLLLNGLIKKVVFTPSPIYYYYQRLDSATHTKPAAERMPALECSFEKIGTYREERKNYLWIESTVKLLCSTREAAQYEKDKETVSQCNTMADKIVPKIMENQATDKIKKIALAILAKSALAYSILLNGKNHVKKLKAKSRG